jgi:O-antigen biosynthesis protein
VFLSSARIVVMNLKLDSLFMELSIIIVSYNVRHFLEQCLNSVKKASENIDSEIFVVDNNSADGSCSMVKQLFPEVTLIRNSGNAGFAVANNQAIKKAKGRFILLLNPDTIVEEDTFVKCIAFMNDHIDAGSVGVKMIDGKGKYLPESKRALPTPEVAFSKIFGLASIFPDSPKFNKYYMGFLDKNESNPVEILTGAFMFIRKETLDKTGLLDENFFMYGEDIDLSYRIIKSGFKNYYYPDVTIIHYKGQSTKKSNINYVINFYKAMLIFLVKHFNPEGKRIFFSLINLAVWFRAFISILKRMIQKVILPICDATIIYTLYLLIIDLWQQYRFGGQYSYPGLLNSVIVPIYILIWVITIAAFGGYRQPARIKQLVFGTISGTGIILVIYALIPDELRFSRALILIGGVTTLIVLPFFRYLLFLAGFIIENPFVLSKKTVVVANENEYSYFTEKLKKPGSRYDVAGRVSIANEDIGNDSLGNLMQLREIIRINRISTVIFNAGQLNASQIINSMIDLEKTNIEIKIGSLNADYFIGSNTKKISTDVFSIGAKGLRRKKYSGS